MIYSRFGTPLSLISKTETRSGQVCVQATTEGSADVHQYRLGDLTADDGTIEITAAVAKLPPRVLGEKGGRRKPHF